VEHYWVELSPILDFIGADMRVADSVEFEPLKIGDETFTFTAPVTFDVTLTNTSAGIVAAGKVRGDVRTECARCLEPFEMAIVGEVEAFYVGRAHAAEMPEEQPVEPLHDTRIDLVPPLMTALVVEAPFAPVHAEDCKGICPKCGANLNLGECGCADTPAPSPFDALKGMLSDDEV
jgi:uncharacterized protein